MQTSRTPVNWLRAFEVAARHLSFSAAASELNVTPAAVSQQVRLLEHRLGEQLFLRHARGLRLTRAGETLVPACRESFERLDGALAELFGSRRRDRLVIRSRSVSRGSGCSATCAAFATGAPRHSDPPRRNRLGGRTAGCERRSRHPARAVTGSRHGVPPADPGRDLSGLQPGAGRQRSPHPPSCGPASPRTVAYDRVRPGLDALVCRRGRRTRRAPDAASSSIRCDSHSTWQSWVTASRWRAAATPTSCCGPGG